jgi:hypothetical protein
MSKPVYVGSAVKHPKFEGVIKMGFSKEHLKILADNLTESGWVNLLVSPQLANKEKYSIKIDDWQPKSADKADERAEKERQAFQPDDSIDEETKPDDLPF